MEYINYDGGTTTCALGLSPTQINLVLKRLPKESVHLFVKQWIVRKGYTYNKD